MKYNRSEILDPDRSLEAYLNAEFNKSSLSRNLEKKYQHIFYRFNRISCGFYVEVEDISSLECVAMRGNLRDVTNILSPSRRHLVSFLREQTPESTYQKQAAFFRALEEKNIDVAQYLLNEPEVKYAVQHLTIERGNYDMQENYPFLKNMISRLASTLVMNGIRERGNLAIILAAKAGNISLFNRIIDTKNLGEQLNLSAAAAFICMTKNKDSETVSPNDINMDILNFLMDIPHINRYANTRWYDYEQILEIYNKDFDLDITPNQSSSTLADIGDFEPKSNLTRNTPSTLFSSPASTRVDEFTPIIEDSQRSDDITPVIF